MFLQGQYIKKTWLNEPIENENQSLILKVLILPLSQIPPFYNKN